MAPLYCIQHSLWLAADGAALIIKIRIYKFGILEFTGTGHMCGDGYMCNVAEHNVVSRLFGLLAQRRAAKKRRDIREMSTTVWNRGLGDSDISSGR